MDSPKTRIFNGFCINRHSSKKQTTPSIIIILLEYDRITLRAIPLFPEKKIYTYPCHLVPVGITTHRIIIWLTSSNSLQLDMCVLTFTSFVSRVNKVHKLSKHCSLVGSSCTPPHANTHVM